MLPATLGSRPMTALISVDLPAPLVPAMVTISFSDTDMSMPWTIGVSP